MAAHGSRDTYEALRTAVLSLELMPGQKLSERSLESLLDASRTPIRAALMRLETEGLVERQDRGWWVTPIDLSEIRAVMEYREVIESGVVLLAIDRAEDAEIEALREKVAVEQISGDMESALQSGSEFHATLARLSENPFLIDAMVDILTRISRTRWLEVRSDESRERSKVEHLAIIEALADRDAIRTQQLVAEHSRGTRDRILADLTNEHRRLRGRGVAIVESAGPTTADGDTIDAVTR